jgi:hypothetical protein
LAQVKRNARRLWENIALYTALCKPISTCEYYDDSHGREVHRRVELFENKIDMPTGWNHIERIGLSRLEGGAIEIKSSSMKSLFTS